MGSAVMYSCTIFLLSNESTGYFPPDTLLGDGRELYMRNLAPAATTSSAMALPCLAQTVLKSEPLILAPYEVADGRA